jgi:hypothetical protein
MLAPPRAPVEPTPAAVAFAPVGPPTQQRGPLRVRRIALLASLLCLVPGVISYANALTQTSNSGIGIRTVEWLRDNGARGLVNWVESTYYSLNGPATGGPGLRALPNQPGIGIAPALLKQQAATYRPPRVRPVIHPALTGEGVWRATFQGGGKQPPVLVTSFRPDPNYPQLVAGVAWIDTHRTTTWLYPGRQEPAVSLGSRGPMQVPAHLRPRLVATFNSGFKLKDSGGGFAIGGRTYAPMKQTVATFVRYRDGRVDVIPWGSGSHVGSDIIYARQNLPLIVDNGQLNPNLSDGPAWGATLGNAIRVWRSAVGVDRNGNLIYAAANIQTVSSLARIMRRAGAVRAMELDINAYWTSFITYRAPGAAGAANLLPTMDRPSSRYLSPEDRDFFAVYLR